MDITENLLEAQTRAAAVRPRVGGFPYLAEVLREAGFEHVRHTVGAGSTLYRSPAGTVVEQGPTPAAGVTAVPVWDGSAVVDAIRADQEGRTSYPEFVGACRRAGVVAYDVDLRARTCTYHGADPTDQYTETYPAVALPTR